MILYVQDHPPPPLSVQRRLDGIRAPVRFTKENLGSSGSTAFPGEYLENIPCLFSEP